MRYCLKVLVASLCAAVFMADPGTGVAKEQDRSETYRLLELFGDVFERVRADYVEEVSDEELIEAASVQMRKLSYGTLFASKSHEPAILLAEKLIELGASMDIGATPPLCWATMNGHEDIALYLISKGAKCNVISNCGYSPLYSSCRRNY